jgi:hypothetical protein
MRAMMLVIVEVPTIDHDSCIQKEADRFIQVHVTNLLYEKLPRFLRDKPYASSVTVEPFGEGSVAALLVDEVQRLRTVVDVLEKSVRARAFTFSDEPEGDLDGWEHEP